MSLSTDLAKGTGPVHVVIDSTGLKVYGAGEWHRDKHGGQDRRSWRKLHLAVDPDSGEIMARELTDKDVGDPTQVEPLLDQITGDIGSVTALAGSGPPAMDAELWLRPPCSATRP